jgi:6-pyruvoyltetrahydropterin/6-carboxytetrahydropterin synthase
MYTLCLERAFSARHYLIGGDWGPENSVHPHPYRVEVRLSAADLDTHGYLVDLDELERVLEACVGRYRDRVLNELPEFAGQNPSIERFARLFWEELHQRLERRDFLRVEVRIWENDAAWAAFEERPGCASLS